MDGISVIWQFASNYVAGGLDGNVDLTGITDKGYGKQKASINEILLSGLSKMVKMRMK